MKEGEGTASARWRWLCSRTLEVEDEGLELHHRHRVHVGDCACYRSTRLFRGREAARLLLLLLWWCVRFRSHSTAIIVLLLLLIAVLSTSYGYTFYALCRRQSGLARLSITYSKSWWITGKVYDDER